MKHKSFIVPHDFTAVADIALRHAIETSAKSHTTIHILHVVNDAADIDEAINKIDAIIAQHAGESDVLLRPQFGKNAGKAIRFDQAQLCTEISKVSTRFQELTGKPIDPIWRAPGGKTSPRLIAMGERCGYRHIGWSPSGFLGDELDSKRFPNSKLLEQASRGLKNGDIAIAHLGIWSREDPWAPAVLEPLIENWKKRGFCFALIPN